MADFQNKLSKLEMRQSKLVAENANLKHLCQYLSDQREQSLLPAVTEAAVTRDSGDGSSDSSPSLDKPIHTMHESVTIRGLDNVQPKPQQITKGIFCQLFYPFIKHVTCAR